MIHKCIRAETSSSRSVTFSVIKCSCGWEYGEYMKLNELIDEYTQHVIDSTVETH